MKKLLLASALLATVAAAAPAPYPITINSRNQTAPNVVVYQGNEMSFRASFTDGSAASDITGATPFMNWATNSLASGMSTSSWQVVGATTGLVDFTFSPQALNFTPGRYMYEVGLINDDVPSVYRQGVFQINGSPQGSGADAVVFTENVDWSLIGNYYNTATHGPYLFGSGFTYTTNATGQLLLTASITETQDLQAVTENGGTTTEQVTIDAANTHTNTYGGSLAVLGGRVQSGDFSTASGESSHAQGSYVTASGTASHAEGSGSTASGIASHAEGTATTASGNDAHAEGTGSTASGNRSHAEGSYTTASGYVSHAAGENASAIHDNTFVWSDSESISSTTNKEFTVHADNGIRLLGAAGVEAEGTVTAAAFVGVTADAVTYTNGASGLAATDVQAAVDELAENSGVRRVSGGTSYWYDSVYSAITECVDGDSVYVYAGTYTESSTKADAGSSIISASGVSVIGVGRPTIAVTIEDETGSPACALNLYNSDGLSMSGIDFAATSASAQTDYFTYGFIFSGSTNATLTDCNFQWVSSDTNAIGSKMFVAVTGATNTVLENCGLVMIDVGSGNSHRVLATHDSFGVELNGCTIVTENVGLFDTGDLSELSGCVANEISMFPADQTARRDAMPDVATIAQVSGACVGDSFTLLSSIGGRNISADSIVRSRDVYSVGEYFDDVDGVSARYITGVPSDFSGTVLVFGKPTGGTIDLTDNTIRRYIFMGSEYGTPTTFPYLRFQGAQDCDITVEGLRTKTAYTGSNFTVAFFNMTNSVLASVDCTFLYSATASTVQPLYRHTSSNRTRQQGGFVAVTGQEFSNSYGNILEGVSICTNGISADADYVAFSVPIVSP